MPHTCLAFLILCFVEGEAQPSSFEHNAAAIWLSFLVYPTARTCWADQGHRSWVVSYTRSNDELSIARVSGGQCWRQHQVASERLALILLGKSEVVPGFQPKV